MAVGRGAVVAGPDGRGHAHHHRGQSPVPRVGQDHVLTLHTGADVGTSQVGPVARLVLGDRRSRSHRARPDGARVDEPLDPARDRGVEHVPQALHIGAEQRRGVAQPGPGVHRAVVDDVAVGHRLGQGRVVGQLGRADVDGEVVEGHRGAGGAHQHTHVVPPLHELTRDVRSDEPARPDDEPSEWP